MSLNDQLREARELASENDSDRYFRMFTEQANLAMHYENMRSKGTQFMVALAGVVGAASQFANNGSENITIFAGWFLIALGLIGVLLSIQNSMAMGFHFNQAIAFRKLFLKSLQGKAAYWT
jgi:hypothetical protein